MADTMRITYASDFSPASRAAFSQALRLAKATGGELTILHVLPSPAAMLMAGGYVTQETWELIESDLRSRAGQEMDALVKEAVDAGVRAIPQFADGGIPSEEIVRAAEQNKTDVRVDPPLGYEGPALLDSPGPNLFHDHCLSQRIARLEPLARAVGDAAPPRTCSVSG